jgi:hypothetical protein
MDMRRVLLAVLFASTVLSPGPALAQSPPLFEFRAGFWGNLHHFLYVLGRAQNRAPDRARQAVAGAPLDLEGLAARSDAEQALWKDAVSFYAAGLSKKDAVFDDELVRVTRALVAAPDTSDLSGLGLDAALVSTLTRVAPVYRAVWWPRHIRANAARQADLQAFIDKYAARAVTRLTALYSTRWPAQPRTIDLCAYTNWAGAYSTDGGLIAIASTDSDLSGSEGLETLLHEASHQWDEEIDRRLSAIAAKAGRPVPRLLSHAMIFYTSGDIVAEIVPGHEPYATKFGVWNRGMSDLRPLLDKYWRPYLRGTSTFEDAIARIVTEAP